jgi:rfaE bifunctional protein nucleotidyltransferase chain/domain
MYSLLREAGHVPAWIVSSRPESRDVPGFREIPGDPGGVQLVLIAVPDDHICRIADTIASAWGPACKGVVFFHFSGLLTSEELSSVTRLGGSAASFHPLQSITDPEQARVTLRQSFFTVEGAEDAIKAAQDVAGSIGSRVIPIAKADKVLYHASAVVSSNYLVALLNQASEIMSPVGLSLEHLMPLIKGTISNIEAKGKSALTGPISRGDWATVRAHMRALERVFPDILPSYTALGEYTAGMAGKQWPSGLGHSDKLTRIEPLLDIIAAKKSRGIKVVFTNGCFDIIHAGHVSYLEKSRALGGCLVVGLNSDSSVKRIKGPERPINDEHARARVLCALSCVDHVVIFDEDTPYELINRVRPSVLVKGGDWDVDAIVGADVVRSSGGEVLTIPFENGFSTTGIIEKIRE